jgi:hypothetical protein
LHAISHKKKKSSNGTHTKGATTFKIVGSDGSEITYELFMGRDQSQEFYNRLVEIGNRV